MGKIFPDLTTIRSSMRRVKSSRNDTKESGTNGTELPSISNPGGQRSRRLGSINGFTELRDPKYPETDGRTMKPAVYQYDYGLWDEE
jgi:hypothetical protein